MTPGWSIAAAVFAGGALGGAMRHLVSTVVARRAGARWPWGTLLVNVSGAFVAGVMVAAGTHASATASAFLAAGVLGGYTTVSSVALQVAQLVDDRRRLHALAYLLATLALGVLAAVIGCRLGHG